MRASFTIEAAFLMPIIIILLAWTIQLTIGLYEKTSETAENIRQVEELDTVSQFRNFSAASDLLEKYLDQAWIQGGWQE